MTLYDDLVSLGKQHKMLRPHIRPVLSALPNKTAASGSLFDHMESWILDSLGKRLMDAFGSAFGFQRPLRQDVKPHGGGQYSMSLADGDGWAQVTIHLDFQMGETVPTIKALGSLFTEEGEEHVFVRNESVGSIFDSPTEIVSNLVNAAKQA